MTLPARNSLSNFKEKVKFPSGHRFFPDCPRETWARFIEWGLWAGHPKPDVLFASMTFLTFIERWRSFVLLKRWLGHLRQGYEDKGGYRLRWICATEWQIREVVHFHLLIAGVGLNDVSRKRWESRWESSDRSTGFCRIYDADRGAAPYLAKYMHKGGELTKGGYWRGLITPESVTCCRPGASVQYSDESRDTFQIAG